MIIERKEYLEKLIAWKDKQLIKIVTGVRRCGKSMLLEIYRNYLKEHGIEEEQIISINLFCRCLLKTARRILVTLACK